MTNNSKQDDAKDTTNSNSNIPEPSSDDNKKLPRNSSSQTKQQNAIVLLPKRGSVIDLLIPISPHPNSNSLGGDTSGQTTKQPSLKFISITLNPNDDDTDLNV